MKAYALTTIDNPFDPFDQFDSWLNFDKLHDHHCCEVLDRIANTSSSLSDFENQQEIRSAIGSLMALDPFGDYVCISKEIDEEN